MRVIQATTFMLLTLLLSEVSLAQAAERRTLDIKSQPIKLALRELGEQTGIQVVFRSEHVARENVTTPRIAGRLSPQEALERILQSAPGLKYEWVNPHTVMISAREETAGEETRRSLGIARVQSEGPRAAGQEDQEGIDSSQQGVAQAPLSQEEVVVTGTNIRGITSSASPVHIYTREDINRSGAATVEDLLETMPEMVGGGLNSDGASISSSTVELSGKSTANLRGLGASATLVLLNGHRLPSSGNDGLIDISMIPLSALDRVEVLTDGASAIYGSDAIAGVVNFILSRNYAGAETRLRYGTVTDGEMDEFRAVQTFGHAWSRGNILASYQYLSRGDLNAVDRDYAAAAADAGGPFRAEIDLLPSQIAHNLLLAGGLDLTDRWRVRGDLLYGVREADFDYVAFTPVQEIDGGSETTQVSAAIESEFDLSEAWTASLTGVFGSNELRSNGAFQYSSPTFAGSKADSSLWAADAKLTGALFDLPAGSVSVAFGAQYRHEEYDRLGYETGTAVPDASGERAIRSVFAEAQIPLFGPESTLPGVRALDVSLAVRRENYSDFGSTTDPKIGVIWSPTEDVRLRGTWGTSFRTAALDELDLDPATRFAFYYDFDDPSAPDGITTALMEFSTRNGDLGPETSTSFTFGFDYEPQFATNLRVSGTYFEIKFEDRIAQPTLNLLTAFVERDIFQSVILDNPTAEQVNAFLANLGQPLDNYTSRPFDVGDVESIFDDRLANLAATDVRGLDASIAYALNNSLGEWSLFVNGSYLFEFNQRLTPDSPSTDIVDTLLNPADLRARSGVTWAGGGLSTTVAANYVGAYENRVVGSPIDIDSWTTLDLSMSYDTGTGWLGLLNQTVLELSVRNLFDEDPPSIGDATAVLGAGFAEPVGYDPVNASALGRFIAFEIRKAF